MRHLWSLLAGLVAAPLAWLFLATGQHRSKQTVAGWDEASFFDTVDLIGPVLFLAGAGIVLGLLGTLRWSPAGALVAGILFVVPTVIMFVNPFDALDMFSYPDTNRLFGQDLQPWLPVENGTLLVLGALLLMAVFSRQRWRQWPERPERLHPAPAAPDQEALAGAAALTEGSQAGTPMSDDEILAAAAAVDEQSTRTGAAGAEAGQSEPAESGEPDESGEPAPAGPGTGSPAESSEVPPEESPKESPKESPEGKQNP